jgi:hypothetical protein
MQDIDYDNLFIYMSLIFAISIFIILLFGCAFSNGKSQPNILENFFGEEDIKKKILDILRKNEKEIKNKEEKKKVTDIIDKIDNDKINIADITLLIDQLKGFEGFETDDDKDTKNDKDTKDDKTKKNEKAKKEETDYKTKEKTKISKKEDEDIDE